MTIPFQRLYQQVKPAVMNQIVRHASQHLFVWFTTILHGDACKKNGVGTYSLLYSVRNVCGQIFGDSNMKTYVMLNTQKYGMHTHTHTQKLH